MAEQYSVGTLANMAGISVRTLHHFEAQGLLHPKRLANGYRVYGTTETNRLQQILLYREMGVSLSDIRQILDDPFFDQKAVLIQHLKELQARKIHIERLIKSVTKTLESLEGGTPMSTEEKFEAFKQDLIDKNEKKYGAEVRKRWGDTITDASNEKMKGLTESEWRRRDEIKKELKAELIAAVKEGKATGAHALHAAQLHAEYLRLSWPDGLYSAEAHRGLAHAYLADERFKSYYDAWIPGATEVLVDAIDHLLSESAN